MQAKMPEIHTVSVLSKSSAARQIYNAASRAIGIEMGLYCLGLVIHSVRMKSLVDVASYCVQVNLSQQSIALCTRTPGIQVQLLLDKILRLRKNVSSEQGAIVAIGGMPVRILNSHFQVQLRLLPTLSATSNPNQGIAALPQIQLDKLPDSVLTHARRGTAFTFDAPRYLRVVRKLREPIDAQAQTITAPSFDHATKDPVLDNVRIPPECRIVVLKGNYLSLGCEAPRWRQATQMMGGLWFVEVPEGVARERLVRRHLAAGMAQTEAEAVGRIEQNDLINGWEVMEGRLPVDFVIRGA